jgi:ABC-type phosphate transport system substrate-binding protein
MRSRLKIGLGAAGAIALTVGLVTPALAQGEGPRSTDVVGVGSDTTEYATAFLFDGDSGGDAGYNATNNARRAISMFANGDYNGRGVYNGTCGAVGGSGFAPGCESTTNQQPNLLAGTALLRAGTKPVVLPNGSGAGIAALVSDAGAGYQSLPAGSINFARASRLPNSTEIGNCDALPSTCGGLHVFQFGTDLLRVAVTGSTTSPTNAPAGLSAAELVGIYQCTTTHWNNIAGNSGGSSNTIHPLIPQSGSGTRNFFLADLQAANGGNPITLGSCVRTVQEHDPTGIAADPSPQDAIEPFSVARDALIDSGYFNNTGQPGFAPSTIKTLTGTAPDSSASYNSTRGVYFVVREVDRSIATPFQAGGTLNWDKTLFDGATSFIAKNSSKPLIQAAGFTPVYKDCGVDPTSC